MCFSIMKVDVWREVTTSAKELKLVKYEVFQPEKKVRYLLNHPKPVTSKITWLHFFHWIIVDPYQLYALEGIPIHYVPSAGI